MGDSSLAARTSAAFGSTRSGCRAVTPPRTPTATGPERLVNGSPGPRRPASLARMPVDFATFAAVLRDLGVPGDVRELPHSAPTAAAAAPQLRCGGRAIANSLAFSSGRAAL